ncbi:unnamed protein product [Zymoseptoria tritici ST99CH_3D1]|nr:unnamed protein product [Zymoseptoria tritici ST99CH_3D1]
MWDWVYKTITAGAHIMARQATNLTRPGEVSSAVLDHPTASADTAPVDNASDIAAERQAVEAGATLSKQGIPATDVAGAIVPPSKSQGKRDVPVGVQGLGSLPGTTLEPQDHDTEHTAQLEGFKEGNQQRGADMLAGANGVGIIDQPMPDAPPDLSVEQTARAQERPVGAVESAVSPSPDEDAPLQINDETRSVVSQSSGQKPALVTIGDNNSDEWLESLSKADLATAFALQWDRKVLEDFPYARLQLKFIAKEIAKLKNGGEDQVEDDDEDDEQNDDEPSGDDDDDAEDDDAEDDDAEDDDADVDGDVDEDVNE